MKVFVTMRFENVCQNKRDRHRMFLQKTQHMYYAANIGEADKNELENNICCNRKINLQKSQSSQFPGQTLVLSHHKKLVMFNEF